MSGGAWQVRESGWGGRRGTCVRHNGRNGKERMVMNRIKQESKEHKRMIKDIRNSAEKYHIRKCKRTVMKEKQKKRMPPFKKAFHTIRG